MAYFDPYIDDTGYHYPTYDDVVNYYVEQLKLIYGSDIYLEVDSQDYQMLSIRAKMAYDLMAMFAVVLANQSPSTSVGTALDSRVEWNGIKRKVASYSTCNLQLTGTVGTIINNGIVKDLAGKLWNLPTTVTITESPQTVTATCQEIGAIEAPIGSINQIITPVKGWTGVINTVSAVIGASVETDEELKSRRNDSVALASLNMVDSVQAGITSIEDVKKCKVYENDTNVTDDNGIPPHSISCVVTGGDNAEIAQCIYERKGGGTGTYADDSSSGFVEETVTTSTGLPVKIQFCRPIEVPIKIQFTIQPTSTYIDDPTQGTKNKIKEQIMNYFADIGMGDNIFASSIIAVAFQAIQNIYNPEFRINSNIYLARDDEELDQVTYIELAYNERATLDINDLTILGGVY